MVLCIIYKLSACVNSSACSAKDLLTVPDLGAGHNVGLGVVPLVEPDARVSGLVDAWNLDERGGSATTGALNAELSALHVELSLAYMALVKTDVLEADEVFSRRDVLGDLELEAVLLPGAPRAVVAGAATAKTRLPHLEPVAGAVVLGDLAGGLGHVDEARAWVLDGLAVEDLQRDLIARLDRIGLGNGLSSPVAAEVVGGQDVGEGWVVRVAVFADIVVLAADGLAVDVEDVKDVVGLDKRSHQGEEREGLHSEKE